MFNPLNSLVCSCITSYSDLIRLALYFKKIRLSALSGSSRARCSVMTPPAVLKRRSQGTKRTEHYPPEISGTWYHFGRNRSRNRIRKNGRISGQPEPEPDIRYIPNCHCACPVCMYTRVWKCTVIFSWMLNTGPHSCIWGASKYLAPALPRSGGTRQNFWIKLVSQQLEGLGYSAVKVAWS